MQRPHFLIAVVAGASLLTAGCVTDPNTGHKVISRAALGAGVGVLGGTLLGGLIGGGTGRILGASLGGIAGGAVGYEKDKQMSQLREKTAGTGVTVASADNGQSILVTMPGDVTFATGSYDLNPQFRATLTSVAQNLNENPNSLIDVYGYTDSTGSAAMNQTLSENRARTVANFLTVQGVNTARIRSEGFGATMPIADNATADGRAQNRRVAIKIVPITQQQVQAAQSQAQGQ